MHRHHTRGAWRRRPSPVAVAITNAERRAPRAAAARRAGARRTPRRGAAAPAVRQRQKTAPWERGGATKSSSLDAHASARWPLRAVASRRNRAGPRVRPRPSRKRRPSLSNAAGRRPDFSQQSAAVAHATSAGGHRPRRRRRAPARSPARARRRITRWRLARRGRRSTVSPPMPRRRWPGGDPPSPARRGPVVGVRRLRRRAAREPSQGGFLQGHPRASPPGGAAPAQAPWRRAAARTAATAPVRRAERCCTRRSASMPQ